MASQAISAATGRLPGGGPGEGPGPHRPHQGSSASVRPSSAGVTVAVTVAAASQLRADPGPLVPLAFPAGHPGRRGGRPGPAAGLWGPWLPPGPLALRLPARGAATLRAAPLTGSHRYGPVRKWLGVTGTQPGGSVPCVPEAPTGAPRADPQLGTWLLGSPLQGLRECRRGRGSPDHLGSGGWPPPPPPGDPRGDARGSRVPQKAGGGVGPSRHQLCGWGVQQPQLPTPQWSPTSRGPCAPR